MVAEYEGRVGFTHVLLDDDSRWRAFVENLHVTKVASDRGPLGITTDGTR